MKLDSRPAKIESRSIRQDRLPVVINQESTTIFKHIVQKGYQILSKNDFGKNNRCNVGYFNKKTNFIVGEKNSLMFYCPDTDTIKPLNISEVINTNSNKFLIYNLNQVSDNAEITVIKKGSTSSEDIEKEITIKLNYEFGYDIGDFINKIDLVQTGPNQKSRVIKKLEYPDFFEELKLIVQQDEAGRININKDILLNSNPEFLVGILDGLIKKANRLYIKNYINLYNFTYILNMLGAQYSIRNVDEYKHIRFKLPIKFKRISSLHPKFFKEYRWYFCEDEGKITVKKLNTTSEEVEEILYSVIETDDFYSNVNHENLELIPVTDLVFIEVNNTIMYDLTMQDPIANNYMLPITPLNANSDGDVLGVVGLLTLSAAAECSQKFGPESKEKFLSLNDASVQNWGIKLDAALGLYNATK